MQTRRDQLQAYRFQNRRALAALVTGEPNVVEPPMRRLTVVTVSGIMIAILVAVVFALLGMFSPDTGDSWKQAGAIIVERETGATYVIPGDGKLHPVINYASAALAVGANQTPHVVTVDRADIKNAPRGFAIGIRGLPDSLPREVGSRRPRRGRSARAQVRRLRAATRCSRTSASGPATTAARRRCRPDRRSSCAR